MNLIDSLNWRYATKRMTGEKIPVESLEQILEAIRLAPTSYGLQPFKVTVVEDKDMINEIYEKACPQIVLKQCSQLLIFRTRTRIGRDLVDGYVEEMVKARNASAEEVEKFRQKIKVVQNNLSINKPSWAMRQTYLALGYATFAAAQLRIDSTPIEGFNAKALNEVLGLNTDMEEAVVMLTLGYRDEKEDKTVSNAKIRRPSQDMFHRI